jgi:hypothetical protein
MSDRQRHHHRNRRPVWLDTSIAAAFLTALTSWAITHHTNTDATVTLPVGRVTVSVVLKVLRALERAQQSTARGGSAQSQGAF